MNEKNDTTCAAHRLNVIVLRSNIIFCDICCFISASRRMSSLKTLCSKLLLFYTTQHLPTTFHPNGIINVKRNDVISIFQFFKLRPWSWKSTPGFGFSDSTRLVTSESTSAPNFDRLDSSIHGHVINNSDLRKRTSAILEFFHIGILPVSI